jgi:ubiquinone/menaquinone biosynthesis C-methylase UbiE
MPAKRYDGSMVVNAVTGGSVQRRAAAHVDRSSVDIQRRYYTEIARVYDAMHVRENDGHDAALRFISALVEPCRLRTVLDVGCGTGRAVRYFRAQHAELVVHGIEPIEALLREAVDVRGVAAESVVRGRGECLPYADGSFDAVCEFGILHHVRDPNVVVREMLRVARRAVFLSDANRFGQGAYVSRLAKLVLHRAKLWPLANYVKTRGRGYTVTAGDGLAYSYSVFDSYDLLSGWAPRVILVPTCPTSATSWAHPLLTAGQVLACALRE